MALVECSLGQSPDSGLMYVQVRRCRFDNLGEQDAKVLCVITPAAIGPQYFREVGEVLAAATGGPPDGAKMIDIMRRHGLTPALADPPR